jgi:hypothetical protein
MTRRQQRAILRSLDAINQGIARGEYAQEDFSHMAQPKNIPKASPADAEFILKNRDIGVTKIAEKLTHLTTDQIRGVLKRGGVPNLKFNRHAARRLHGAPGPKFTKE